MSFDPVTLLLAIPAAAALLIALLPGSKASATLNAGASSLTFLAALSLALCRAAGSRRLSAGR